MAKRQHRDDTKAAVLAALLAGQSVSAVAREYDIPRATIIDWRDKAGVHPTAVPQEKRYEIGDMVMAYLAEVLESIRAQAIQFRDSRWLAQQSAEHAAVLHGVMVDKAVRLLEALNRASANADGVGGPGTS